MKLRVGDRVLVNTPSMAMGFLYTDVPSHIESSKYVGKIGTVVWTKDFTNPEMQGIKVRFTFRTGWSYFTGKEFTKVTKE
jgi:hypothetical protein